MKGSTRWASWRIRASLRLPKVDVGSSSDIEQRFLVREPQDLELEPRAGHDGPARKVSQTAKG